MNHPAIFELDADDEATGQVYRFCSLSCADEFQKSPEMDFPRYAHGTDDGAVRGEACTRCGGQLAWDDVRPGCLYANRDTESLGDRYIQHVEAMTAERLHDKSAVAAELAYRDQIIAELSVPLRILREFEGGVSITRGIATLPDGTQITL